MNISVIDFFSFPAIFWITWITVFVQILVVCHFVVFVYYPRMKMISRRSLAFSFKSSYPIVLFFSLSWCIFSMSKSFFTAVDWCFSWISRANLWTKLADFLIQIQNCIIEIIHNYIHLFKLQHELHLFCFYSPNHLEHWM